MKLKKFDGNEELIPTVASLVPEPVIVGDNVSVDSWDDIQNDVEGPKSVFKRLELFFSCLGYSVGLCNIWRFPYMIHRNGGAFLLPFTIMVVFVGMPLYYLELVVAQFTSRGPIALWEIVPFFKGIGYSMAILSFIVSMYYNVIISWTLLYLFYSMHYHEPWNTCTESSYAPDCINTSNGSLSMNQTTSNDTANANDTQMLKSSFFSDIFFHKTFLKLSDSAEDVGVPQWQISLCLLLVCCFIFVCLLRNIKSFGKVSYFTSTMVIIFLVIFLVKVISDDQSYVDGVKFFISIDWNTIKSSQVWMDAAYEVIFSLGPCLGGLIALASTNDFHNNCYKNALGVVVINSIISVFGGFVAYSLLGHFSQHVVMRPEDSLSRGERKSFLGFRFGLLLMGGKCYRTHSGTRDLDELEAYAKVRISIVTILLICGG
ncbi:SLC6A7 (predicted) [Pycnogonum litorale]